MVEVAHEEAMSDVSSSSSCLIFFLIEYFKSSMERY